MHGDRPLLPHRSCGPCRACCTVYDIDDAPVRKLAGVVCPNHDGSGCTIYATRPETCRVFHCQWRYGPMLAEEWRPDLSGVVITTQRVASGAANGEAISLKAFGDHAVIFNDGFAIYAATMMDRGYEVLLKIPRGIGRAIPKARLSVFAGDAVRAGNLAAVKQGIERAYYAIMAHPAPFLPLAGPPPR